jgi:hypothetical protein
MWYMWQHGKPWVADPHAFKGLKLMSGDGLNQAKRRRNPSLARVADGSVVLKKRARLGTAYRRRVIPVEGRDPDCENVLKA